MFCISQAGTDSAVRWITETLLAKLPVHAGYLRYTYMLRALCDRNVLRLDGGPNSETPLSLFSLRPRYQNIHLPGLFLTHVAQLKASQFIGLGNSKSETEASLGDTIQISAELECEIRMWDSVNGFDQTV